MPLTNAVPVWTLVMPLGSTQLWNFVLTDPVTGSPFPITGAAWEYIVRDSAGNALFSLTTSAHPAGQLTVTATSSLSQVAMDMTPAATSGLTPATYSHALWMNPGASNAYAWFTGQLQVEPAAQP